jgi:hypothetical protein
LYFFVALHNSLGILKYLTAHERKVSAASGFVGIGEDIVGAETRKESFTLSDTLKCGVTKVLPKIYRFLVLWINIFFLNILFLYPHARTFFVLAQKL